jgi:RNA polymerase sigma-70 factor (ECF subfamily)
LRAAKRREQRDTLWSQPEHLPPPVTVEDVAASNQFQVHLELALSELPEKLRLALLLSAMDGYTIEEIAALMGIPIGTVKSRIFIARKKLAEKLRCYANTIKMR